MSTTLRNRECRSNAAIAGMIIAYPCLILTHVNCVLGILYGTRLLEVIILCQAAGNALTRFSLAALVVTQGIEHILHEEGPICDEWMIFSQK